jgi:hypothetical protein
MTRLLIGNDIDESIRIRKGGIGAFAQRIIWFAQAGDIVVLPEPPQQTFIDYALRLRGVEPSDVQIVVPPEGRFGLSLMSSDRLNSTQLINDLTRMLGNEKPSQIIALWPTVSVADIARAIGAEHALPGFSFIEQNGGHVANNKAIFRALAAGAGVPIAPGAVCPTIEAAERVASDLIGAGHGVMMKQAFNSGGQGNELIIDRSRRDENWSVAAAVDVVDVQPSRSAVRKYLDERWSWLTRDDRHPCIVEQFIPDCVSVFADFELGDSIRTAGTGEMRYRLRPDSLLTPLRGIPEQAVDELRRGGDCLARAYARLGYRGRLSADAITSRSGSLFFTECNAQFTGSAHVYDVIARELVRPDDAPQRTMMIRIWPDGWWVSSVEEALTAVEELDLLFDPIRRTGVIITVPLDAVRGGITYCVVDQDEARIADVERRLAGAFAQRSSTLADAITDV